MRKIAFMSIFLMMINLAAVDHVRLKEILNPNLMAANENYLYIAEGTSVSILNLKSITFLKRFGRKGEGPGEFKHIIGMFAENGRLIVNSIGKNLIFSPQGDFLSEKKLDKTFTYYIYPLNQNYVASYLSGNIKKGEASRLIAILNKDLKPIKILASKNLNRNNRDSNRLSTEAIQDFLKPRIYSDRIFIGDTKKGFFIEVFNGSGTRLYCINKDYEKLRVTKEQRENFEKKMNRKNSYISDLTGKKVKYTFREHYPAFKDFIVQDNRIFVLTYKEKDKEREVVILDLNGQELNRTFIPGAKIFFFGNGNYYYLIDNEDEEEWELHWKRLYSD